jgi:hypothetical protein
VTASVRRLRQLAHPDLLLVITACDRHKPNACIESRDTMQSSQSLDSCLLQNPLADSEAWFRISKQRNVVRESRTEHMICQSPPPPTNYTCTPADESLPISYVPCLFRVQLAMHLILSVKSSCIEFTGRLELVYYCTCQRVSKEKLQVAGHKPIIWRIRGLGTPKDLLGWASAETPPGSTTYWVVL